MSSLAVTNTLVSQTTITASQHNTNYSDIVNYINNRNSGSNSWDALYSLSASNIPIICDNSTGTQNIADFRDNGTSVMVIANSGATSFTAINGTSAVPLTINNGTSTGSIFIAKDNGSTVFAVADGGGVTLAPVSSNTNALIVTGVGTGTGITATGGVTGGSSGLSAGILGTGGGGNSNGGYFVGTGSFAGAFCQGGASNGAGINGQGTGAGPGGNFTGGSTGQGAFCQGGSGGGSTQALALVAGTNSAHLNMLAVTSTPSALANGDMWIENVSGTWHLKVRMNGITSTIV